MNTLTVESLLSGARAVVRELTPAEVRGLIDGPHRVLLVDVRDRHEREQNGCIEASVHVSRGMLEFRLDPADELHDPALAAADALIFYCGSGGRSLLAAKLALDMGYRASCMLGGMKGWRAAFKE